MWDIGVGKGEQDVPQGIGFTLFFFGFLVLPHPLSLDRDVPVFFL